MPLAKSVVERSALPGGELVDSERLNVMVVDVLRQLVQLTGVCDVIFAELLTEAGHLADRLTSLTARTTKLSGRLDTLDALTVTVRTYAHTSSSLITKLDFLFSADCAAICTIFCKFNSIS